MAGKASLPCTAGYPATQSSQGTHSYISTVLKNVLLKKSIKVKANEKDFNVNEILNL